MFKDASLRNILNEKGFSLIPLLSFEKTELLKELYQRNISDSSIHGLYANHNKRAYELNLEISNEILQIVSNDLERFFENFSFYIGHFMVKEAQTKEVFKLHQDWNIVDERSHPCYQIWIPLQFTEPDNGGLFFVPGSHRFFHNYRSGSFDTPRVAMDEKIELLISSVIVPTGSAFIYSNALFHGSYPNLSGKHRISVIVNIVEKNTPTFYFHKNNGYAERYAMSNRDILMHLPELEQGIVHESLVLSESESAAEHISNGTVNSTDIEVAAAQHKKLYLSGNETKISPVLTAETLERQIDTQGYATTAFLNFEEAESLKNLFHQQCNLAEIKSSRYTTLEFAGVKQKQESCRAIIEILKNKLDDIFLNYKIPLFRFFVKQPRSSGDVDETKGTLTVLPQSHLWYKGVVTYSIPWPYLDHQAQLRAKARHLTLKAGELVIFDNRLIHGSTFNSSDLPRICIAGRITHQLSQYYSFIKKPGSDNRIGVYAEMDDIYLHEKFKGDRAVSETGAYIGDIQQIPFDPKILDEHG